MNPRTLRSSFTVAIALCFLVVLPASAQKRRAVRHPAPAGPQLTGNIKGTVLDAVTGLPVISARVTVGQREDVTDSQGKFEAKNVTGSGFILVEAKRSGYVTGTQQITTNGDHELTLRLSSTPTTHIVKADNTTIDVDTESVEFGYPVPFSGYRQASFEDFCRPNGTHEAIEGSLMKKITGPAVLVTDAPCCPGKQVLKINIEFKTGQKSDLYFFDGCDAGATRIDLIARDHVNGRLQFVPFTTVKEVVFP